MLRSCTPMSDWSLVFCPEFVALALQELELSPTPAAWAQVCGATSRPCSVPADSVVVFEPPPLAGELAALFWLQVAPLSPTPDSWAQVCGVMPRSCAAMSDCSLEF